MLSTPDIVMVAVAAYCLLRGAFRGMFRELLSLAGLPVAVYLAGMKYMDLSLYLGRWLNSPTLMAGLAYLLIFVGVMLAVRILAGLLARVFRIGPPYWIDFLGGAVLGAAKGVLLVGAALAVIGAVAPGLRPENSRVVPYIEPAVEFISERLPQKLKNFDPGEIINELDKRESRDPRESPESEEPNPEGQYYDEGG
jgi:membrane protein required for colicin V production